MDSLAMKMDPDNAVGDVGDIEATLNYIRSRKRGLFGQIHQAVTLKGFNGLKKVMVINSFDIPSNDLTSGIHLTTNSEVINLSEVGIEFSSIAFNTCGDSIEIAPVSSTLIITIAPNFTSSLGLAGRVIPQNS
ncbi:hypothetical protein EDD22DRAFT_961328 [Suillus occidentalis]|nr:hypothetical protein EDD22DRAFT_961328 [Suillus occidentalis]